MTLVEVTVSKVLVVRSRTSQTAHKYFGIPQAAYCQIKGRILFVVNSANKRKSPAANADLVRVR